MDTTAKHEVINIDDDDIERPIYRVFEVSRLLDIFESRLIGLTAPHKWDDPYESFLRECYGVDPQDNHLRISFESFGNLIFGQCWSLNSETDATWRIYSPHKNGVKVKTTIKRLHKVVSQRQEKRFRSFIGRVMYRDDSEIENNIRSGIQNPSEFQSPNLIRNFYLVKRKVFEHEKEIRLLVRLPTPTENQVNAVFQDPKNLDVCELPVDDPAGLFDEIVFDPRMSRSVISAYTSYLTNNLGFDKKVYQSNIYTKPNIRQEVNKDWMSRI